MPSPGRFKGGALGGAPNTQLPVDAATGKSLVDMGGSSVVKAAIAASIARARTSNPFTAPPWFKPKPWATGATFRQGMACLSSDGVNEYVCTGTTGFANGLTAATGSGPVGVQYDLVGDNQCLWEWLGPTNGKDNYATFQALVTFGTLSTIAAKFARPTYYYPSPTKPVFSYTGGTLLFGTQFFDYNYPRVTTSRDGVNQVDSQSASAAFWTNGDLIGFTAGQNLSPGGIMAMIEINDAPLTHGASIMQLTQYDPASFALDLSYWGPGAYKKVRIKSLGNNFKLYYLLNGIILEAGADIFPAADCGWKLAVEGDSLTGGGNGVPYAPGMHGVDAIAARLGCDNFMSNALGGTGFVNNGGSSTRYIDRIEGIASFYPDAVGVAGNLNDAGSPVSDQITAATQYFKALRPKLKNANAPIVVFGNEKLRGSASGPGSALYIAEQSLATAVTAAKDPYLFFVPNLTSSAPTFSGLGNATTPLYDGNADRMFSNKATGLPSGMGSPDAHPIYRGYQQSGLRKGEWMADVLSRR